MKKNGLIFSVLIVLLVCVSFANDILQKIVVMPNVPSSSFNIEIAIDKGDGGTYKPGETMRLTFKTNRDAYVVLYNVHPSGVVNIIFPNKYHRDNFVRSNTTYHLPERGYNLTVDDIVGTEYIQAIASTQQFMNFDQWQQSFRDADI